MSKAELVVVEAGKKSKVFDRLNPFVLRHPEQAEFEMPPTARSVLWIVARASHLQKLVPYWSEHQRERRLLLLEPVESPRLDLLNALFKSVVVREKDVGMLDSNDIAEVLAAPNKEDLFIGGRVDRKDKVIVVYRGDLSRLIVPFSVFRARRGGTKPNYDDFEVIDCGQTIRLGAYEAAGEAILYELDADYRRRARKNRIRESRSFGAALRRLRLQRGMRLTDFRPDVTDKEVGRIERNEVKRPRPATVKKIAARLGVEPEEIASY
ncbi:MAG: helix-turn-helix transcriptional regulator [Myxococcota bacterium]